MNKQSKIVAAALAALAMGGCATRGAVVPAAKSGEAPAASKGECWGVNACKGQGACGGDGHDCAGQNDCKGKGWLSLTKTDCDGRGGKFKRS